MMTITYETIKDKVINALCVSLALEKELVKPESRLIYDLNMDSLDFLDIMFALETEFSMKIRDDDFDRVLRPDKSEAALNNEFLSESEIRDLTPVIPDLENISKTSRIPRNELFLYITVDTLVKMIGRKINK
jgi:acyl carrier protein